jgi:hypothetical protein
VDVTAASPDGCRFMRGIPDADISVPTFDDLYALARLRPIVG